MKTRNALIVAAALFCGMFFSLNWTQEHGVTLTLSPDSAQAVVGRPATPRSVAGVARRTTRRAVRHY
jgi:hypothetical protein